MKKFLLIIVFLFMLSCNRLPNKLVYFNEISFEWIGDTDKPFYKLVLCVDCVSEKNLLLRKIKISEECMQKIYAIGFDNNQLKIDENNKQDVIQKLIQIDQILDEDVSATERHNDLKIFIKRIP